MENKEKDPVTQEKERLLVLVLKNQDKMTRNYQNTIKHTGGLLTQSMTYAYSKALNDVLKLLTKGES